MATDCIVMRSGPSAARARQRCRVAVRLGQFALLVMAWFMTSGINTAYAGDPTRVWETVESAHLHRGRQVEKRFDEGGKLVAERVLGHRMQGVRRTCDRHV